MNRNEWLINRLLSMSAQEVAFRFGRAVMQRLERPRIDRRWSPGVGRPLVGSKSLLGDETTGVIDDWNRIFQLDECGLEGLLQGKVWLFGRLHHLDQIIDWHRDPLTGIRAPLTYGKAIDYRDPDVVGDIKVLWELGRHQHLVPLAVAYAVTGDLRYRQQISDQIDGWVGQNPYGVGIHWCSALEVALRGIAWTMVHSMIVLRDGGSGGLVQLSSAPRALVQSIYEHGYFIRHHLSRYSSANNHLIGELVGLMCLSTVFDFGRESRAWSFLAARGLEREVERQVHRDGVSREQATHYHLEVLEYFVFACCVARSAGVDLDGGIVDRVLAMSNFLRAITPNGGLAPHIGDSDDATVNRFRVADDHDPFVEVLMAVDATFGFTEAVGPSAEKSFWYGRISRHADRTPMPTIRRDATPAVSVFPDAGYAVLRADQLHLVFDAGSLGFLSIAAHGHADAMSFCAAWKGAWWLVDPGTYAYHGDQAFRSYFRGTRAHNTATIDGVDQSRIGGPFLWTKHATATLEGAGENDHGLVWAQGYHDGYRRLGWMHHRRLEVSMGHFDVIDRFVGRSSSPTAIDLYFHFAPDVEITLREGMCIGSRCGLLEQLTLRLDADWDWQAVRGSMEPILGWYSERLGEKQPCWTLRATRRITNECSVRTAFSFRRDANAEGGDVA